MVDPDGRARRANVPVPPERGRRLYRDPSGDSLGQNRFPVDRVLALEQLPAGQSHHSRSYSLACERVRRRQRDLHLGPGGHEDHLRSPAGSIFEHVAAPRHEFGGRELLPVEHRQILTSENQGRRSIAALKSDLPGHHRLVCVARPDDHQTGHCPHGSEMLDRLVGGTILTQSDTVVREHVDGREMGEGRQPDSRAHVVGEDQERSAIREDATVGGKTVQYPTHRVLAHPEVQVAGAVRSGLEVAQAGEIGVVGRSEVGGAAQESRHHRREGIEGLARRGPGGQALSGGKDRQLVGPPVRQSTRHGVVPLLRESRVLPGIAREHVLPAGAKSRSRSGDRGVLFAHPIGDGEEQVARPAQGLLGEPYLVNAQWRPVGFGGAGLVGAAAPDDGVHHHQRGLVFFRAGR